jgi:hypothetical protein
MAAVSSLVALAAPETVQTFAGYASLQVTMDRYGHVLPSDDHRKAMNQIARGVFKWALCERPCAIRVTWTRRHNTTQHGEKPDFIGIWYTARRCPVGLNSAHAKAR